MVKSEAQWGTKMSCNLGLPSTCVDAGRPAAAPGWQHAENLNGADGAREGGLGPPGPVGAFARSAQC